MGKLYTTLNKPFQLHTKRFTMMISRYIWIPSPMLFIRFKKLSLFPNLELSCVGLHWFLSWFCLLPFHWLLFWLLETIALQLVSLVWVYLLLFAMYAVPQVMLNANSVVKYCRMEHLSPSVFTYGSNWHALKSWDRWKVFRWTMTIILLVEMGGQSNQFLYCSIHLFGVWVLHSFHFGYNPWGGCWRLKNIQSIHVVH